MKPESDSSRRFNSHWSVYRARVYERYFSPHKQERIMPPGQPLTVASANPAILVIEDNADEWFLIRWTLLKKFPKAELVWLMSATDVKRYVEADQQRERQLPQLILLDLYLPTPELGLSTLQLLKSHPHFQPIPVVMVSRLAEPEYIEKTLRQAATSYIVKPTTYQQWLEGFSILDRYWTQTKPGK